MFKNNLKIAIRNLLKDKWTALINITGLAVGMACCILIMLWVQDELRVDQYHEKIDNLYLVGTWVEYGNRKVQGSGTPPILGPMLKEENPEILNAARMANGSAKVLTRYGDVVAIEKMAMADPTLFELFDFPFILGNPKDALDDPRVIVLNESMAYKYFGDKNPIGEIMTLENQYDFRVVGVIKDIPYYSTIKFKFWTPFTFIKDAWKGRIDTWYNLAFRTYIELDPNANYRQVSDKISGRIKQSYPSALTEPYLYPFKDIYLKWWGNQGIITLFSMIAIGILSIACINFINLATARSTRRAREVGMRKVVGAQRPQLMRQFLTESVLVTLLGLVIAIFIVELFLPAFNILTGKPLKVNYIDNGTLVLWIILITLFTGLLSGLYPAAFLASFRPIRVIKSGVVIISSKSAMRKGLVIAQFTLTIILIIGSIVIYKQTQFMQQKDLGFNKEQMLYIPLKGELAKNYAAFKNEVGRHHTIANLSLTSRNPVGIYTNGQNWQWQGKSPDINPLVSYLSVDEDFLKTFEVKMAEGEFFSPQKAGSGNYILVNEKFGEIMKFKSTVNQRVSKGHESYTVLGVVKDFHYKPVYANIGPLMLFYGPDRFRYKFLFIRINTDDVRNTIEYLQQTAQKFNPDFPFEYHFFDDDFARLYQRYERYNRIVTTFAGLAILISCLGLFGLITFMAEQKTKEIGVRKALGARVLNIVSLLSKEFAKWVLIANLIAWPAAWILMNAWLLNFAYKTEVSLWIFLVSGLIALLIALLTVSSQAIKAALANPIEALRYE